MKKKWTAGIVASFAMFVAIWVVACNIVLPEDSLDGIIPDDQPADMTEPAEPELISEKLVQAVRQGQENIPCKVNADCETVLFCILGACLDIDPSQNVVLECVFSQRSCADNNLCTEDECDELNNECVNSADKCDDGLECTFDTCQPENSGICVHLCSGEPGCCDDGDPCTDDACNPDTAQCENVPVVCDDGDPCTDDICSPDAGCVTNPIDCKDDDDCTVDTCEGGECFHTFVDCDDEDDCTDDECLAGECVNTPVECEPDEKCVDGVCTSICFDFRIMADECVDPFACGGGFCSGECVACVDKGCFDDDGSVLCALCLAGCVHCLECDDPKDPATCCVP